MYIQDISKAQLNNNKKSIYTEEGAQEELTLASFHPLKEKTNN